MDRLQNETPSWFIAEAPASHVSALARTLLLDEWQGWGLLRSAFVLEYPRLVELVGTDDAGGVAVASVVCDIQPLTDEAVGAEAGPDDDFGVFFVRSRKRGALLWPHPTLARLETQPLGPERCRFRLNPERRFTRFAEVGALLDGLCARLAELLAATPQRPGAGSAQRVGTPGTMAAADEVESRFRSRWFRDREDFIARMVALMARLWCTEQPTQAAVGKAMAGEKWYQGSSSEVDARQIRHWCTAYEVPWPALQGMAAQAVRSGRAGGESS